MLSDLIGAGAGDFLRGTDEAFVAGWRVGCSGVAGLAAALPDATEMVVFFDLSTVADAAFATAVFFSVGLAGALAGGFAGDFASAFADVLADVFALTTA